MVIIGVGQVSIRGRLGAWLHRFQQPSPSVPDPAQIWRQEATASYRALRRLGQELATVTTATDQSNILMDHGAGLDACRKLIHRGRRLARTGQLRDVEVERLRRARSAALTAVSAQLATQFPVSVEKLLRVLALNISVLAYGTLSLCGLIWLGGFYSRVGIEVLPLLRDVDDVALVGLTSGLVPALTFATMAAFAFWSLSAARDVTARDTASAADIVAALRMASRFRSASYWWVRIGGGLILMVNLAAILGPEEGFHKRYDLVAIESVGEVNDLTLLGAVGGFTIFRVHDGPLAVIPADDILCMQKVERPAESVNQRVPVSQNAEAPADTGGPPVGRTPSDPKQRRFVAEGPSTWSADVTAFFESGSAEVLNQDEVAAEVAAINRLVERRKFDRDQCWVEIRGYTDRVGSQANNVRLSGRRTQALAPLLFGWPDVQRITTQAGESGLAQFTSDEMPEALNRRATARLLCPVPASLADAPGAPEDTGSPPDSEEEKSKHPCRLRGLTPS